MNRFLATIRRCFTGGEARGHWLVGTKTAARPAATAVETLSANVIAVDARAQKQGRTATLAGTNADRQSLAALAAGRRANRDRPLTRRSAEDPATERRTASISTLRLRRSRSNPEISAVASAIATAIARLERTREPAVLCRAYRAHLLLLLAHHDPGKQSSDLKQLNQTIAKRLALYE